MAGTSSVQSLQCFSIHLQFVVRKAVREVS